MDKLMGLFHINRKFFVFLLGILFLGVIFGSILPIFLSVDDKKLVSEYLIGFVSDIKDGFNSFIFFKNGFINEGLFIILIWFLGISVIGIPIVLFLFFYKCFIFGFSISSIIVNYGFKGILFGLSYIFPHHVISILIYLFLSSYCLIFSLKLLLFILKKYDFDIRTYFRKYLNVLLISVIGLFICILYESFVNPYVLGFIFNLLGI